MVNRYSAIPITHEKSFLERPFRRGAKGIKGEKSERGARGEKGTPGARGPAGKPAREQPTISAYKVDTENYKLTPLLSNGQFGLSDLALSAIRKIPP